MTVTTTKIPAPQPKDVFNAGKVLTLSICHFIHDIYSSFLAPLLPLLVEKFSMTLAQAGFLSTIMQIPALFNPFIGLLADRITVRYFIILAPATTAPRSGNHGHTHEPFGSCTQLRRIIFAFICHRGQCGCFSCPCPGYGITSIRKQNRQRNEFLYDRR